MRSETEPVEEVDDEWAGSEVVVVGRSVETVMRVRVAKNRREDLLRGWLEGDELVGGTGWASSGG